MPIWRNTISCFVLQNTLTWLTILAWLLLLSPKEAENTNSHNSLPIPADECGAESGEIGELLRGGGSHGNT